MEFLNWHNQQILTESGNSKNTCGACTDISMHNTSRAALCSGQMGIPLQWHAHDAWNQTGKTDIEDFYANFDALASFVDGLDFENHKYRPSVQNEICVDAENTQNIIGIKITSVHGKQILALNNFIKCIEINELTNGLYFISITKKNGSTSTYKFIKN